MEHYSSNMVFRQVSTLSTPPILAEHELSISRTQYFTSESRDSFLLLPSTVSSKKELQLLHYFYAALSDIKKSYLQKHSLPIINSSLVHCHVSEKPATASCLQNHMDRISMVIVSCGMQTSAGKSRLLWQPKCHR